STPPPLPYVGLPTPSQRRAHSRDCAQSLQQAQANNLIAPAAPPLLIYDMSLPPSTLSMRLPQLFSARLFEPAVYPPLPLISLVTSRLPWALAVPATNGKYVSVSDVLSVLYRALRVGATLGEFAALRTEELMRRVTAAYLRRCECLGGHSHSGYAREQAEGVKRVDFLLGYTTFCGIAEPGVWQLKTV
ncbi:hypothetical protein B0H14DRAFT_2351789, partial [Mycena olivaceomarginata]